MNLVEGGGTIIPGRGPACGTIDKKCFVQGQVARAKCSLMVVVVEPVTNAVGIRLVLTGIVC